MKNTKANKHIRLLALVMALMMLLTALAGCTGPQGEQGLQGPQGIQGEPGKDGKDGIDGTNGKDGIDGTNGKDGINGTNGVDGLTPFVGENGNWWIGETDTGIQAAGQNGADGKDGVNGTDGKDGINGKDGDTPYIGISGNWCIGELDTGIKATGANGKDGESPIIGENGNWWIGLYDTGVRASATDGKSVVFRVENNWLQWKYDSDSEWLNLYEITLPEPSETGAKVTFKLESGVMPEGTPTEIIVTPGTSVVLPTPSYAGYTFGGWYRAGGSYPVSSPYRVHDNAVLYAKWIPGTSITGTPIYTLDDLVNISNDLGGTYILMNDIDCMGLAIPPIGGTEDAPFRGIFDGNGYTISNLSASATSTSGLFGYNSGTIQNLKMQDCNMSLTSGKHLGVIAGINKGTIEKCAAIDCSVNIAKKSGNSAYAGLICADNSGLINNCYVSGSVYAQVSEEYGYAGGITATNRNKITNCWSNVSVTAKGTYRIYTGGISAETNNNSIIENCVIIGSIKSIYSSGWWDSYSGDAVGYNLGVVLNCYKDENLSVTGNLIRLQASPVTKTSLNNSAFYSASLKWDSNIWDWSDVDIVNGKYPKLKVIR